MVCALQGRQPLTKATAHGGCHLSDCGREGHSRALRLEPVSALVMDTVWVEVVGDVEGQEMNLTRITQGNRGYATQLNNRELFSNTMREGGKSCRRQTVISKSTLKQVLWLFFRFAILCFQISCNTPSLS